MEPLFFKKANNSDHADEFRRCLPVNVNTSFATLAPAIATAEQQRLLPVLGDALFTDAAAYYFNHDDDGDDPVMNRLVELTQMAVVRLAYWDSFDQLSVMMGDRGISDSNGENRAYRYQADALRASLLRQGYAFINQLIGHCTAHIDTLPLFAQSPYYTERQQSVIHTMEEFDRLVDIGGDFTVFMRLRQHIAETEYMELPYRIGSTLATALVNDRDNQAYDTVRDALMGFTAHWSMAMAVPFLNLRHTADGIVVTAEKSGQGRTADTPTEQQVQALAMRHKQTAERYIGQAVTYMKAHADLFPAIGEIGTATDHEHSASMRDNRGKKTFLV